MSQYRPAPHVCKAIRAIRQCRTGALGGRRIQCSNCGYEHYVLQSCGNRNCPICPALKKELWLLKRQEEVLPNVDYFHVVYTLPHQWNPLFLNHPRALYTIMFKAVRHAYLAMIKDVYQRASGGMIAIVHTWGQNLSYHPHIHTIVPGAGLSKDEKHWVASKSSNYLLAVKDDGKEENDSLSRRFKKAFLRLFIEWWEEQSPVFRGEASVYNDRLKLSQLLTQTSKQAWVVYSKAPTKGADQVLEYLSRYVHRVAFSESRILEVTANKVHFGYKDYSKKDAKNRPLKDDMWLGGMEFLRRFAQHILPARFQRIRYYGIWSSVHQKKKLAKARQILGGLQQVKAVVWSVRHFLKKVLGIDPDECPSCGQSGTFVTTVLTDQGELLECSEKNIPTTPMPIATIGRSPPLKNNSTIDFSLPPNPPTKTTLK